MKEDDIKREIDRMIDYRKPNYPHDNGPLSDAQVYQIRKLNMNEKIKLLAGQALDQAVPETWTTLSATDLARFTEKFAQLIVDDICADMLSLEPMYPANIVALKIKQKYGVPI